LLDAKDLIDVVEHSKPVSLADLKAWLKTKSAKLVFSLENIRALAGPLGSDPASLPRIVQYLRDLEALPHCFISCHIDLLELRSALRGYDHGLRYEAIDPYVPRFDFTFHLMAQPSRPNYTMAEAVADLYRTSPRIFSPRPNLQQIHAFALNEDRVRWGVDRVRYELPKEPIIERLVTELTVPDEKARKIADWIEGDPVRCPGLWLIRAVGSVMSKDRAYQSRPGDVFDMADTMAIPYVEFATLDRAMSHFLSIASSGLNHRRSEPIPRGRVFKSLKELLAA
jgi:hypothetical protein